LGGELLVLKEGYFEPVAEFNEPTFGGLEGTGPAEVDGKFSNLFFVS
jgi:hypothetical protein